MHGHSSIHYEFAGFRQSALREAREVVVLNLKELAYADSLAIAQLAMIPIECGKRRLGLRLIMPDTAMMREALQRLRIFESGQLFEDEAAALGDLQTKTEG